MGRSCKFIPKCTRTMGLVPEVEIQLVKLYFMLIGRPQGLDQSEKSFGTRLFHLVVRKNLRFPRMVTLQHELSFAFHFPRLFSPFHHVDACNRILCVSSCSLSHLASLFGINDLLINHSSKVQPSSRSKGGQLLSWKCSTYTKRTTKRQDFL